MLTFGPVLPFFVGTQPQAIKFMTRTYPALLSLLLLTTASFGQVRYGIQGGVQASNIAASIDLSNLGPAFGVPVIPVNQRVSFRAGVMADVPLGGRFSLRPQLLYSVKGGDVQVGTFIAGLLKQFGQPDPTSAVSGVQSKAVINYVELPVMVMYGIAAGRGRVVVGAGPYAAVAMGGSLNGEPINFNLSNFRKLDLGATASLGYELSSGLSVSGYYTQGFTNISKSTTPNLGAINPTNPTASLDPSAFGGTLKNRTYGLTIGYFF